MSFWVVKILDLIDMDLEKFYHQVYQWLFKYGLRFVIGLVVLLVGLWLIKLLIKWVQGRMQHRDVSPSAKPFLLSLASITLRLLLILGVMQILGIEMTLFATLVGAFGVAAGLTLSGTLQNFASGVIILLLKPFTVGDNIITQGMEGTVKSIQIFYTLVTTFDNRSVIVPNSKLSNEIIINISREGIRRLDLELKFNNGIDIKQIKAIVNASIDKCKNILSKPERRIGIAVLETDGYKLGINVWVNAHGFQDTKLAIQETILQDIKNAGIKIAGL